MSFSGRERTVIIAIPVILALQYAANLWLLSATRLGMPSLTRVIAPFLGFLLYALIGIAIRFGYHAFRRDLRTFWTFLRNPAWIAVTLYLVAATAFLSYLYGCLKISVHVLRKTRFDELLWELDRLLMFGISPNIFFVELFSNRIAFRIVDFLYAAGFLYTLSFSFWLIYAWPSNRLRLRYLVGSVILWLTGVWLYYAVPSLGPAYAYYQVWEEASAGLPATVMIQRALFENHMKVLQMAEGARNLGVNVNMGIAAFPSMHVGFHVFFALWLGRLIPAMRWFGWFMVFVIAVGSVVTGWHYLIDSFAGALLAWGAFRIADRILPEEGAQY